MHIISLAAVSALLALPAAAQDLGAARGDGRMQPDTSDRPVAAIMLRRSPLYSGPSRNFPRAATAYPQNRLRVLSCLRGYEWCDIYTRGARGWVQGADIAAMYRGRRQRIDQIGAELEIAVQPFQFERYWEDNYRRQPFYPDRVRWQRYYVQNYDATWGPGPSTAPYDGRERGQPQPRLDRREERRDDQQRMDEMQRRDPPRPDTSAMANGQRFELHSQPVLVLPVRPN